MVTTHQIRNVLRVYADQLKRRNAAPHEVLNHERPPADRVEISSEARQRQMLDKMSKSVVSQATPGPEEPVQESPKGEEFTGGGRTKND
ncbi:MAG: DVU0524 family FlgM-associated protein [Desulfobacteraceae bacterium]